MAPKAPAQTALDHLHELRRRVSWSAGMMAVGGFLAYFGRGSIIHYLQQPLHEQLFYTSPTGGFEFVMQVCLLGGCLFALPTIVFHLLRFIEPAFEKKLSRRSILVLVVGSCLLTVAGSAFAFYVSLPAALNFFNQVGTSNLHPLISVNRYFNFVVSYVTTFAVVFQLPLILLLIDSAHPLDPPSLGRWRKWVILGSFAVALVLPSAPDPLSQLILALPMIILYEVSLALLRFRHYLAHPKRNSAPEPITAPVPMNEPPKPAPQVQAPKRIRQPIITAQIIDLRGAKVESHPIPPAHIIDLRTSPRQLA